MAAKKIGMGLLGVSGIGVFAYTLKMSELLRLCGILLGVFLVSQLTLYLLSQDGGSSPSYAKATPEQIKQSTEMYKLLKDGPSHSLLKKHLTPEVFEKLKTRATENGGTLYNIIVSGAKNPEAHCGVYAPDAESYKVFGALFDPIIEEYHSFGPKEKQPACDLGEGKTEAFKALDKEGKYIQSTRIRCGRSIKGIPLNPLMKKEHYEEMEKKIKGAVDSFKADELKGKYYPLLGMSKDVQTQLIKDHFLFKDNDRHLETVDAFHYWPVGRGIFHNKDKTFLMWVGEEDHIRIISMESGGDIGKVLNRLNKGIREIETKVPFSRDERLGWITFCPTNLGSTVRASVHIRLPKVSARKDFEKMCDGMQLQVRGIHGEGSKSEGGVYDISNKRRLGLSEYQVAVVFEAVKEMYDGIKTLIEMEERGGS